MHPFHSSNTEISLGIQGIAAGSSAAGIGIRPGRAERGCSFQPARAAASSSVHPDRLLWGRSDTPAASDGDTTFSALLWLVRQMRE